MASGYRNALPFLSEEDVPGVCFIHIKLEKHSVDQLRRWLARRGIKKSWNKTVCVCECFFGNGTPIVVTCVNVVFARRLAKFTNNL